jgi:hypothetical protein
MGSTSYISTLDTFDEKQKKTLKSITIKARVRGQSSKTLFAQSIGKTESSDLQDGLIPGGP